MSKRRDETADAVRGILGEQQEAEANGGDAPRPRRRPEDATPGIPRGAKRQLTIYVDPETAERLAARAEADDRSIAYVARQILREYFEQITGGQVRE